jgi:uncharacterized protein with HEPN domain
MWSSQPSQASHDAERRAWLAQAHESVRAKYTVLKLSTHSLLLLLDVERAFCGGAWLSVIVMSHASIEATYRQVLAEDYKASAASLFGSNPELDWLRELRNEIIHAGEPGTPAKLWKLAPNDVPACHAELEAEARRAVILAYKFFYAAADA